MSRKIRSLAAAISGLLVSAPVAGAASNDAAPTVATPPVPTPPVSTPPVPTPPVPRSPVSTPTPPPVTVPSTPGVPSSPSVTTRSLPGGAGPRSNSNGANSGSSSSSGPTASAPGPASAPGAGSATTSAGSPASASIAVAAPAAPRTVAVLRARRRARANRRLHALVRRLHGCLIDLPTTSARVLTLRAGTAGHPGLSPGATAGVLGVSTGREARLERVALDSLQAAGRAGCDSAATPTIPAVAATHTLTSSPPLTTSVAPGPSGAQGPAPGSRTQTGGVTRSSAHRPAKPAAPSTRTEQRAATEVKGTPAWAVALALGLLALGGAAAVVRQVILRRPAGVPAGGAPPSPSTSPPSPSPSPSASPSPSPSASPSSPPPPSASASQPPPAMAALPAVGQSQPNDAAPIASPHGTVTSEPAATPSSLASRPDPSDVNGPGVQPAQSTAAPSTSSRQRGRAAAVAVPALAAGVVRLLSRRRPGRH